MQQYFINLNLVYSISYDDGDGYYVHVYDFYSMLLDPKDELKK